MRPLVWVGIDVGKTAHHACAVDEQGKVCWSRKFTNDQKAIEQVIDRAVASADQVRWAGDVTDSNAALLLAVLSAAVQQVGCVAGRVVNRMSAILPGEGKSDAKDARVIAETARLRGNLPLVSQADELVAELTRLVAHREDLMADWVRGINRLRDLLTSVFPALEQAFDYSTRSPLILVAAFCTPSEIRAAGRGRLTEHLHHSGAWQPGIASIVDKALATAASQTVTLPGEATTAALVKQLARQLLDLDRQIKDLNKRITDRFRTHPDAAIIESLPGLGPILGAEFVVATGGNLTSFANPGRLASYAGLVPIPRDSGRIIGNRHRPTRYNRRLRRVFYMAALSATKTTGPSRAYYNRKRQEHHHHIQALIALARRLVNVLWALLRDRRTYTPTPPPATNPA